MTRRKAEYDEWPNRPHSDRISPQAVEAISRRRRQVLIHSYIYYELGDNLVPDDRYDKWSTQLAQLQKKFGYKISFFDKEFRGWTGGSGFQLPKTLGVVNAAIRLLRRFGI